MAHTGIHVRLVVLGGAVTSVLTVLWGLAYAVGTGGTCVPLVPLVLGPTAGIVTSLAATHLAGHPAGKATRDVAPPSDRRPPVVPARGTR